jgi:hypothetical protein
MSSADFKTKRLITTGARLPTNFWLNPMAWWGQRLRYAFPLPPDIAAAPGHCN